MGAVAAHRGCPAPAAPPLGRRLAAAVGAAVARPGPSHPEVGGEAAGMDVAEAGDEDAVTVDLPHVAPDAARIGVGGIARIDVFAVPAPRAAADVEDRVDASVDHV